MSIKNPQQTTTTPVAMVIGAAEGMGLSFCEQLIDLGYQVLAVDRDEVKLQQCKQRLGDLFMGITQDMNDPLAYTYLEKHLIEKNCELLVYNAAYGPVRDFLENTIEQLDEHLEVNSRQVLHMAHTFARLRKNKSGGMIIMTSLTGFIGTNLVSAYGATKAFDLNLAEALYHELKPFNIDVLACVAGATSTPNYINTNPTYQRFNKPHVMEPQAVVKEAIQNLGKKPIHIAGRPNRLTFFLLLRFLPRSWASKVMNQTMWSMYKN